LTFEIIKVQIKHSIAIFLLGLLVGVGISPFTNARPQQALKAPIPVTLAYMPQVVSQPNPSPKTLGVSLEPDTVPSPSPTPSFSPAPSPSPTPQEQNFIQKKVTIAIFGDSMVDTMGTGLPYLKTALANYYPNVDFVLLNYGVGAQNVEAGLNRVGQLYSYHDRNYQALTNAGAADIVVIGSFAYNPFSDKDINYHWTKLAELVNRVRASGKTVLLLAENAPTRAKFGTGKNGINWPPDTSWQHAQKISQYLESTTKLSPVLGIPLVDCFHPTLLPDGEGNQAYINQGDHIHASSVGHTFIAQGIAKKIFSEKMIN